MKEIILKIANPFIGVIVGASLNEVLNHNGPLNILTVTGLGILALIFINKN
jgi:hypothetical protein